MLQLLSLRNGITISKEMSLNELYGGLKNLQSRRVDRKRRAKSSPTPRGPTVNIQAGWGIHLENLG